MDNTITDKFAEAATANAGATRNATFAVGPSKIAIAISPTTNAEIGRPTVLPLPALGSVEDHIGPEIL